MSAETTVRANSNLNFRAAGNKGAKVLCVITKGTLIEQVGARNLNGFAKGDCAYIPHRRRDVHSSRLA